VVVYSIPKPTINTMAMGRKVVTMYLLAVWCCANTLVVRALLPSSLQSHARPAISSGDDSLMGAVQVVPLPGHHHHLSSPDCLRQPETSMTDSDRHPSVITGGVGPGNSPKGPRVKDGDDESWEEHRKQRESERGSSLGGGGHDSAAIDVRESEGTGRADVAGECAIGDRFHTNTARIQNLELSPLRRGSRTSRSTPVLPDSPPAPILPAGTHPPLMAHTPSTFSDLITSGHSLFQLTSGRVTLALWLLNLFPSYQNLRYGIQFVYEPFLTLFSSYHALCIKVPNMKSW